MWRRFALGAVLIVALSGAATALLALHKIGTIAAEVFPAKNRIHAPKGLITPSYGGAPQTFLLIGSDKRIGSKNSIERDGPPRSDTMLLVRLDPRQGQTSVLSVPRDLLVRIVAGNGEVYYPEKINAAYEIGSRTGGKGGGAKLVAETIKKLLKIKLNGIIDVTFKGFINVVDSLGCVYVNIDHRYWHSYSNEPGENYSSIHLASGYQKLCYEKALSYVRYRHGDSDFVRVARQQDFLRQLREQVSLDNLASRIDHVSKTVGHAVITTFSPSSSELIRLTKLIAFSQRKPLRQVKFRFSSDNTEIGGLDYVTAGPAEIEQTVHEFLGGSEHVRLQPAEIPHPSRRPARPASRRRARAGARGHASGPSAPAPASVGLYPSTSALRADVEKMALGVPFPVELPSLQTGEATLGEVHRFKLKDRQGRMRHGFIEVFTQDEIGGAYYDVEGMTWPNPPLIFHPTQTEDIGKRHYMMIDDGPHIHVIAWREGKNLYWVNNTLLEELSNAQMIYIAQSTRKLR